MAELNALRSAAALFPSILPGCVKMIGLMAVLHITYKSNAANNNGAYEGFCNLLKSYQSIRLSKSNWAINTEEPPKAVWQKLKCHIKPHDYFVMFPLDASLLTAQDQRILQWVLARP